MDYSLKKYFKAPATHLLFLASLLCIPASSWGSELSFAPPKTFYVGLDGAYNTIKSGEVEYNPISAKIRIGVFFHTNVALEASYSGGVESDTMNDGSENEIDSESGLFLRFQSPIQQGIRVYVFGGYNTLSLSQTTLSGATIEESYDSAAWGIGLEEHFKLMKKFIFFAEYRRPYDDEFRLSNYSLGARYQF